MSDKGFIDKAKGSAKEGIGRVTGNKKLEYEGKVDQAKGKAKKAVSDVKDAADDVAKKLKK